jgi:hypothetical protein
MSATTEYLIEQINQVKEQMASARRGGLDTAILEAKHSELLSKLNNANNALNENKQILKG